MKKKPKVENFEFKSIGHVQTLFKDKFGVPRQPGLVAQAKGVIKIHDDHRLKSSLRTLEEFSHLWILFVFHDRGGADNFKPSIRPPRLGGSRRVGVLSSRSPHRPNPIGMSAVVIEKVDLEAKGGPEIHVGGVDLLDGTPVLDIKPYIPYADSIPEANAGWASAVIERTTVHFNAEAEAELNLRDPLGERNLRTLITQMLELDPRPAFQKRQKPVNQPDSWGDRYGFSILDLNVQYEITADGFLVLALTK